MMKLTIGIFVLLMTLTLNVKSQDAIFYRTGFTIVDVTTPTTNSVVLMGGAGENDKAMKWFLQQSGGGDIVVLRTDDSNGYNNYLYSQLGVTVHSVTTIVCLNYMASYDTEVINTLMKAEGVWFAGGDQATYINQWNNTPIDTALDYLINTKKIPVGGISAGMAIQGQVVFTAVNGTISSNAALQNPFNNNVTLLYDDFLHNHWLHHLVTETHFDNPDRKGRLITFMARMQNDIDTVPRSFAIACEEFTAVCIDPSGLATVYGDYPDYDDHVYFLQTICEPADGKPETCLPSTPLTWDKNGQAITVYNMLADSTGTHQFNLNDWKTASGGSWEFWYVLNGVLYQNQNGTEPNCSASTNAIEILKNDSLEIFPNPTKGDITVLSKAGSKILIYNMLGELIYNQIMYQESTQIVLPETAGIFVIMIENNSGWKYKKIIVE